MKKFPWRSVFYLLVLLYLILDLKACNGPLKRKIAATRPASEVNKENARKLGWVALVNQEPVTRKQLDLAVARYLYQRGKDVETLSDSSFRQIRRAALRRLIDDILIRHYADGEGFEAPQAEAAAFIRSWENQFHTEEELAERIGFQELSREEVDKQLARIWSRKRWLEKRIAPGIGISEEDVRDWFDTHREEAEFIEPEKIKARHIFVSTVEEDGEPQETKIRDAHERLTAGEDFGEVAAEVSEDERTKNRGGELNWFSRNRIPEDFAEQAFAQEAGKPGEPFRTKIGWHIVEVLERKAEQELAFDDAKEEIRVHLLNVQTRETVQVLLGKLRKVANIVVFTENLE